MATEQVFTDENNTTDVLCHVKVYFKKPTTLLKSAKLFFYF